jgi:glycosyltransferase involved in cell wall biosynthesis
VCLLGDISEQLKADILADCDVFASPSREEAFGITTLEAWAQERPVVVGDSPGQRSVVDEGALGLLVPHGDARRLLEALTTLARDEMLRARLGRAGKERVMARHQLPEVVRQYHSLFLEAAEAARSGPAPRGGIASIRR